MDRSRAREHRRRGGVLLLGFCFLFFMGLEAQETARQKALALEQQGQTAQAEQVWKGIAEGKPAGTVQGRTQMAEADAHLGLLEARQEHYPQAEVYYRKALALNPAFPGLRMNLGLALFKDNKFKEATVPFAAELRAHPGDTRLIILLGMSHYGMGDYFVAIPYLKQAAAKDAQNLPLRLALAHSCLWSKQYDCVMETYKQILALNAESAEADILAGEALDEKGDSAGAIEQFRAAVTANPKEPNVHFGLGYLLWKQSQFDEAAQQFEAELVNDPGSRDARIYLGDSFVELNDYAHARPELEKALTVDPTSALVHRDLGVVYADAGNNDGAILEFQKAMELDPKDVNTHWRLAKLYQKMGRRDEAKAEFAKASSMTKQSSDALYQKIDGARSAQP